MTDRTSIFRREALEFQAGAREHGAGLQIDRPWTRWLYWLMLAFALVGVAVAFVLPTDETTSGPARIDVRGGTFVALIPDTAADLRSGHPVRLDVGGGSPRTLPAQVRTAEVTDGGGARRAGFPPVTYPAVLVTGALAPDADVAGMPPVPRQEARAVVVLRSARLMKVFFDGVDGLLGGGGDE